jgi:hypothetical protein
MISATPMLARARLATRRPRADPHQKAEIEKWWPIIKARPKEAESGGLNDAGVLGIRIEHATGVELVAPADSGLLFFVIPDSR